MSPGLVCGTHDASASDSPNRRRHGSRTSVLGSLLSSCFVLTCLAVRPAEAQVAEHELWGELRLVGGVDAARRIFALSPQDHRLDAEWLPDFIYRYGETETWGAAAHRVHQYVQYLDLVRRSGAAWPSGVRAPGAGDQKPERDRV